ncbi:glycerol-3-phosphate dehydrogenase [Sphingosinicella sp. YJ22]|uniref:glycerol-3-phosphate dehydrogenase n=1 Tax=Sphingosinicella sp. YJ22 TaxID=1104780 RepID=UPI00140A760B|nr:glycerol-3-phosphate dehydrogenase [Sphingosinicella sp. YJ22]
MDSFDLLVIGGGINGAAIARDAAGRGLSVLLVERDDLASHTSSASSKLAHGGLRYLEQYEFRLVRESLREREILLRNAPHIVRPLRFILPDPAGGRPWWLIRLGLLLYGLLAGRSSLPRPRAVRKDDSAARAPLKDGHMLAEYWDGWLDDARLVVLNAMDAKLRGAEVGTRTELLSARREGERWLAQLSGGREVAARMVVNAAGPWVCQVLHERLGEQTEAGVRLVKGTHIVVPRLYDGDHAYILQQPDGRVVFALPYGEHNLVGTTDTPVAKPEDEAPEPSEIAYLCEAANRYFVRQTDPAEVVWSFGGIRALYDDGAADAKDVTRDYRLELDDEGPKLLSVFGGKITTARALASEALDTLGVGGLKFTATSHLPGGDIDIHFNGWLGELAQWMPQPMLLRMAQAYGTRLRRVVEDAASLDDLGRHFGADLYEAEVRYLVDKEFARTAEDVVWRRTKLGLRLSSKEQRELGNFIASLLVQRDATALERLPGDTG